MTVHLLWHGMPLCRFNPGLAGNWPAGHKWVGLNDKENRDAVDCLACASEAFKRENKEIGS